MLKKFFAAALLAIPLLSSGQGIAPPTAGPFTTGVNAVTAGGASAGWVSGNVASLAANGVVTVVWDAGPLWHQYPYVMFLWNFTAPSTTVNPVYCTNDNTTAINTSRRMLGNNAAGTANTMYISFNPANGAQAQVTRLGARYISCSITNADAVNALGASSSIEIYLFNR